MSIVEVYIQKHRRFSFRNLLEQEAKKSKIHVIVTFLAVLELMKTGKVAVQQEETFGEILIEAKEPVFGEEAGIQVSASSLG